MAEIKPLLPCPFCGEKDDDTEVTYSSNYNKYYVECSWCGLESPHKQTKQHAIDFWNDRPLPKSSEFQRGFLMAKKELFDLLDGWNKRVTDE